MEPDITATSSSTVVGVASGSGSDDCAIQALVRDGFRGPTVATAPLTPIAPAFSAPTRGHGAGHANGHAAPLAHADLPARAATEFALAAGALPAAPWAPLPTVPRAALAAGAASAISGTPAVAGRDGFYSRHGKRLLDLLGGGVALVLSAPLVLIAAIAIRIESPGPVFYRSTRVGRGGRPFTFYKLRSMVNGADRHRHHLSHLNECDGPVFKMSRDPRVTAVGRFLRTTSLDELPQFWNVVRGDMSLVGPRPPLPDEVSHYQPWQMRRLDVRPGLTCLWQIGGRSHIGFEEWMRLDLEYIRRQSFPLDLRILLRTIPAVLSREGAY